jgi:hypothetical protein
MGVLSRLGAVLSISVVALTGGEALALETDQFYAWGRSIEDGSEAVNAWMGSRIEEALAAENARPRGPRERCEAVARRIRRGFYFFIFQEVELWATQTSELERVPNGFEETIDYRRRYLFESKNPFDTSNWMPPSPTIEIGGVRLGTDKLSHFASTGWWYHERYLRALRRGKSAEEAERAAIRFGILSERTIFGASSTGALSMGDLEANHQGMRFYNALCGGQSPYLARGPRGWRLVRPFDIRDYVTPEWDESWNPPIYRKRKWRRVERALRDYCERLENPAVRARRELYAARDRVTTTERAVAELVEEGKLDDPASFRIERVCGARADR